MSLLKRVGARYRKDLYTVLQIFCCGQMNRWWRTSFSAVRIHPNFIIVVIATSVVYRYHQYVYSSGRDRAKVFWQFENRHFISVCTIYIYELARVDMECFLSVISKTESKYGYFNDFVCHWSVICDRLWLFNMITANVRPIRNLKLRVIFFIK